MPNKTLRPIHFTTQEINTLKATLTNTLMGITSNMRNYSPEEQKQAMELSVHIRQLRDKLDNCGSLKGIPELGSL